VQVDKMALKKPLNFKTTFAIYTVKDIIGEGGSGRIYRAVDDADKPWAIKLLDPKKLTKNKIRRFKNELFFCLKNKHPNIVTVVDHGIYLGDGGSNKSSPFYVMPIHTCSLRELLQDHIQQDKVLPYFSNILDGIEAAHLQKVIHRDLKPENILYDEEKDRLLIADFGIAHFEEEELYTAVETQDNERLANFQYAAPEQRVRNQKVDHRTDIYALGLMLNEMFTGQVPYGTGYKTVTNVTSDFGYLDELISEILRQSPEDRPPTIEAIKIQLKAQKNEFITRQRISELRQTVIPETEVDDPLIIDPPRLKDFDWDRGNLTLILSQPINSTWINALQKMGSHRSLLGKGPERFSFSGNKARINAREDEVQEIINYFKTWLPNANRVYEQMILRKKQEAEERERQELQRQIEEEEARKRVLEKVKI